MNDPVTNVEIEDVLSSIRRLVSEDARVRPAGWQAEPVATAAEAAPVAEAGRLVLTPALRVTEDAQPEADAPEAEMTDADTSQADGDAATVAEEAMEAYPEEGAFVHHADHGDHDDAAADAQDMSDDAEEIASSAEDHHGVESYEDEGQGWATAEAEPLVLSDAAEEAMVWEDHHEEAEPDAASRPFVAEVVTDDLSEDDEVTLHPVAQEADTDHDPDAGFVFASTRDGSGHDRTASAAAMEQADDSDPMDDRAFLLSEDETVLDEETLREMVAEIVRQELQGALGERITRNVRKLVRREIHRAMTSHELE
jgi:hypothetical protein